MKTRAFILSTLFAILTFNALSQNCMRSISSFVMLPGGYVISGTATLERLPTDSLKLSFSANFNTLAGPDLHVYLTIMNDAPTASGNTHVEVAPLISNTGAQTYYLNDTIDLDQFNYVVIHCKQYNHVWGGGLLGSQTGNCLSTSSNKYTEDLSLLNVFPNPTFGSETISITNIQENSALYLYDVNGNQILKNTNSSGAENLYIGYLKNGIYFLEIKNSKGTIIRKIILTGK